MVNSLLAACSADPDHQSTARRLAAYLLETADVAPQQEIAEALGYESARTIRHIRDQVEQAGLEVLLSQVTGRPPVTTQSKVIQAVIGEILSAIMEDRCLPDDAEIAEAANRHLSQTGYEGEPITEKMVQTIRLAWEIKRPATQEALSSTPGQQQEKTVAAEETISLGYTRWGGAFVLLALLIQEAWLAYADLLPIAPNYAVTPEQLLLTALFAPICGISRAFHLDDVRDVGFALLTGRPRPLTHGTFQHLIHALPLRDVIRFYRATSQHQTEQAGEEDLRVSMDGHTVPRFTKLVDLPQGRMGSTKRIEKVDNVITSFALDLRTFLTLRIRRGAKQLHRAVLPMTREILRQWKSEEGILRLFLDRGAFHGLLLQTLKILPRVHFYIPAVRYPNYVETWEELPEDAFEEDPFVFERDKDRAPPEERISYHLADRTQEVNLWKDGKLLGTVMLRAIILFNPQGETTSERWFVLLTDDRDTPARQLTNEYGDHWEHEMAHRVGKHELDYDILPPSYRLETHRDQEGNLVRKAKLDIKNTFLISWLRCLTFDLITFFGKALGGVYARMRAGTLLRKFIHRPAKLLVIGDELHVVFDPFKDQAALRSLLEELNEKRIAVPWLNGLVLQFFVDEDQRTHPLTNRQNRKWFLDKERAKCPA